MDAGASLFVTPQPPARPQFNGPPAREPARRAADREDASRGRCSVAPRAPRGCASQGPGTTRQFRRFGMRPIPCTAQQRSWIRAGLVSVSPGGVARRSLAGEPLLSHQLGEARLATQRPEHRVNRDPGQAGIALDPGTLQPLQRAPALATEGVDLGDLVGRAVAGATRELVERPLRRRGTAEQVPTSRASLGYGSISALTSVRLLARSKAPFEKRQSLSSQRGAVRRGPEKMRRPGAAHPQGASADGLVETWTRAWTCVCAGPWPIERAPRRRGRKR